MKKIILSILFFTLFIGTAFSMNSAVDSKLPALSEGDGFECVRLANAVSIMLETLGVSDDAAFQVATVVYHACQEQAQN